ncbi:MAG: peptidase M22 [Opitutaceae bacterium]|nr:peptidase M22 [Opitutaceae bacterium]
MRVVHSLDDLLHACESLLVLDCASSRVHVGLLRKGNQAAWAHRDEPAGSALFACVDEVTAKFGMPLPAVRAFAFNDGPGSILGIRTAAVAIRTWQAVHPRPAYRYSGLLALALAERIRGRTPPFSAIADARRDTWHQVKVSDDSEPKLLRVAPADLTPPCVAPEHFRTWAALPPGTELIPSIPRDFLEQTRNLALWHDAPDPDAFLHEDPSYKTWQPGVHRAPSP